jgi:uncharacterized protein YdhG (YjbR/CyaY superfamily)
MRRVRTTTARNRYRSVSDYIEAQPGPARSILRRVRAAIRKALPRAEEGISYQIPAYKVGGRAVVYFAGWTTHYSVYPATASLRDALGMRLAPYEVRKGTIRFPLAEPVPARLIADIARFRAKEEDARPKTKRR